ncbi:hypothetical protein [Photobacterium nomapromontoriensis]
MQNSKAKRFPLENVQLAGRIYGYRLLAMGLPLHLLFTYQQTDTINAYQ